MQRLLDVNVAVRRRARTRALGGGRALGSGRSLGRCRSLGLARRLERLVLEPLLLALELLGWTILRAVKVGGAAATAMAAALVAAALVVVTTETEMAKKKCGCVHELWWQTVPQYCALCLSKRMAGRLCSQQAVW